MLPKNSRRDFLGQALKVSTIAAFPQIVPSRILASATAPSNIVNVAIIGCGGRSGPICGAILPQANVRIVAAVDPYQERREAMCTRVNGRYTSEICKPYESYEDVLADPQVDGVFIVTPDHWHVPIAIAASNAGKDVYIEKPLSISMKWSAKLREVCAKNKTIVQYGTQQRSMQASRDAADLIRNGYIGELKRVDVWSPRFGIHETAPNEPQPVPAGFNYDLYTGPAALKPYTPERTSRMGSFHCYDFSLGYLGGWGAHPLDLLQWCLDADDTSPVFYEGTGALNPEDTVWDTIRTWDIHMKYANGLPVRFMSNEIAKPIVSAYSPRYVGNGTTFFGSEGMVIVSRAACLYFRGNERINLTKFAFSDNDSRVPVSKEHTKNFIDCIQSRKETVAPLEAAIRSDTISHMSDIVVRTGKSLNWDPKMETIVDGSSEQIAYLDREAREPYSF